MQIQLNSDNRITGSPELLERVQADLEHELKHVASAITRVEVHLNDVNGAKGGEADKRCLLEARIKGAQPVAVESRAATIEQAISTAAGQLSRAIKTNLGKSDTAEKRGASIRHLRPDDEGE
ncbi:HPF/RaiA family ribosome-associated protein [Massilia glaciei]|uniref:Ribosomal subunit interface protein n=1 Tax=Massilia glaciei TaxID=1524097 RepID=A0A2U2HM42_9BURK|nr:HPF/RaiA family ribosome-associated protein [Massilia glaciei]PWF48495.1 ribosomal subunit interface protein [Massilia glaciei]